MTGDLFAQAADEQRRKNAPLAERMRPRTLDEVAGQRFDAQREHRAQA